jgi:TorA maturation chaperone TorD
VRAGKDSVLVKASTWKEKKEIMDSLLAIDRWLESRYSTKFERPMVGDR